MASELACRTSASATAWWAFGGRSCHDRASTGMPTLVAVVGSRRHPPIALPDGRGGPTCCARTRRSALSLAVPGRMLPGCISGCSGVGTSPRWRRTRLWPGGGGARYQRGRHRRRLLHRSGRSHQQAGLAASGGMRGATTGGGLPAVMAGRERRRRRAHRRPVLAPRPCPGTWCRAHAPGPLRLRRRRDQDRGAGR
jgi:hypothetical protein